MTCLVDDYGYPTTQAFVYMDSMLGEGAGEGECVPRRDSPVCVIPDLPPSGASGCVFALAEVFESMVGQGFWISRYASGKGDAMGCAGRAGRAVATGRLVAKPACDASNVVAGAFALFCNHFAERADAAPRLLGGARAKMEHGHLGLVTRLRLAACLAVVYKFERGTNSFFRRRFVDADRADRADSDADSDADTYVPMVLAEPHTRELSCVGYNFLYRDEQTRFGPFSEANGANIKGLYNELLRVEADLLRGNCIFGACTRNAQVVSEDRLEALFQSGAIGQWELMEVREFTPIFFRALVALRAARTWPWGEVTVGGMVVASLAVRLSWPMAVPCATPAPRLLLEHFTIDECMCGRALLDLVCDAEMHFQQAVLRGVATPSDLRGARRVLDGLDELDELDGRR